MSPEDHAHDLAREIVGNHTKFQSHAWHIEMPEDFDSKWATVYTSSRGSGLLEKSNESAILRTLRPFTGTWEDGDAVEEIGANHFALGYLDGFIIRVYDAEGELTPAFLAYAEMHGAMENYPILDESDYCEREFEATLDNVASQIRSVRHRTDLYGREPDAGEVYRWLSDNDQGELENTDDCGGFPSDDSVLEALLSLGMWYEDDCDSPQGDAPVIVNAESPAVEYDQGDYLE